MGKIMCISAQIFKSSFGDCSNNGITHRFTEILIPHEEGWIEVDAFNPPENFCEMEIVNMFGKDHVRLKPKCNNGKWQMFGGCFAYSSDSRFDELSEYPIPIHDRIEE